MEISTLTLYVVITITMSSVGGALLFIGLMNKYQKNLEKTLNEINEKILQNNKDTAKQIVHMSDKVDRFVHIENQIETFITKCGHIEDQMERFTKLIAASEKKIKKQLTR